MPNLGVIKGKEDFEAEASTEPDYMIGQRATLADLPGLIEGAHNVRRATLSSQEFKRIDVDHAVTNQHCQDH